MALRKRQRGLTFISLLVVLILIGFFALIGLKLFPIYMESLKIDSIMDALVQDPEITGWSKTEIRKRFINRTDIEDLDRFNQSNLREYMSITKTASDVTIDLSYQAETPLFGNLTLVADFEKVVSSE